MIRKPEARPGFTLTEVLMAMFVMAIGMISLLALFPAGFLNARWALDTEQVSRGAANAQSMSEIPRVSVNQPAGAMPLVSGTAQSIRNDDFYRPEASNGSLGWQQCVAGPLAVSATARINTVLGRDSYLKSATTGTWAFNGNINLPKPIDRNTLAAPVSILLNSKVKYPPVFVDPTIASNPLFINGLTGLPFQVGSNVKDDPAGNATPFAWTPPAKLPVIAANTDPVLRPVFSVGIPRFTTSQYARDNGAVFLRMLGETSLGDEVDFARNGLPNTTNNTTGIASGQYAAQRRFSWAYMCHWYDYATPEVCDAFTVVFNGRPTNGGLATFPPGENSYYGYPNAALNAGIEAAGVLTNHGRIFVKGLNQAAISLYTPEPSSLKVGDWILDSTMILPEFSSNFSNETAPFLDEYDPRAVYVFPQPVGAPHLLRPGLVGGHFYKVLDVSPAQLITPAPTAAGAPRYFQTITLDRPAKSDGFAACHLGGIADVITKGVGRMPQR